VEGIREKPVGPKAGGRVLEEVGSKAPVDFPLFDVLRTALLLH